MPNVSPLSYNSTDNYERIQKFAGIMQERDGHNINLAYAVSGKNFNTENGTLKPYTTGTTVLGSLPSAIGTLATLYRRYGSHVDPTLLVASAGGKLYARVMSSGTWSEIYSGLQSNSFDYVTYEVNTWEGQQLDEPVDVLLLTNAKDGMFCVRGDDLSVTPVTTPKKFGILARHAERIWGSGIEGDQDMLVYSAPFDPFNWELNPDIPEDGAGDIIQPSWDGDSFVALRPFGSQLIAFKKKRVWRILGTDPGNYIMKEQYGGGVIAENTAVVNNSYILMLGYDGIMMYDGTDVSAFHHDTIKDIMKRLNRDAIGKACAAIHNNIYYLALPLDSSATNNAVIVYNITERAFNLIEGIRVSTFMDTDSELLFTSDTAPSSIFTMSGGNPLPVTWVSAWQDAAAMNVSKTAFEVMLSSDTTCEVTLGLRTEKKLKEKTVLLPAGRIRKVRLSNKGRNWRLEISSSPTMLSGDPNPVYSIVGGLQIMMEMDYD